MIALLIMVSSVKLGLENPLDILFSNKAVVAFSSAYNEILPKTSEMNLLRSSMPQLLICPSPLSFKSNSVSLQLLLVIRYSVGGGGGVSDIVCVGFSVVKTSGVIVAPPRLVSHCILVLPYSRLFKSRFDVLTGIAESSAEALRRVALNSTVVALNVFTIEWPTFSRPLKIAISFPSILHMKKLPFPVHSNENISFLTAIPL